MNYKINQVSNGFRLLDTYEVKEINSVANIFIHEKSGAKLLHLENDDDDKVFSVAFKTPPNDSTGVPHIVEHCVLSGSRKYKTKEPFMDMVKGSLKTFINAMTFADKTIYPVASRNEKDFTNLMDVYLDSVFFPMIHEDKEIFMQEGWHYDIHDKNDPITYKGVVYNEMRGAYSSPNTLLGEVIGRSLFPDTTYKHSSGGNPDVIPELTYEDFKKFHKDYYHPSNSYIYVYGNGDIEKYMKHINDDYLTHFDSMDVESSIDIQTPFESIVEVNEVYPISSDEEEKNKTYLSMNYVIGSAKDPETNFMADILKELLVNSSAGPIKKALLDAGIGEDIMCSGGGGLQLTISIIAKNAELDQKDSFIKIVSDTLKEIVTKGIDKDLIESCINIAEYDMREASGFATKGIIYHILSMSSWLYEGHPTNLISYDDDIKKLRENIMTDYFEKYITENMINNKHASIVTLVPKKGLGEEKTKQVEAKLARFKESLSDEEIEELIKENISLKNKQLSPDSKEALATIPMLEVSDVSKKSEEIPREIIEVDEYKIINHEIFSNDISYVEFLFDTTMITKDEIPYLGFLTELLGELDTKTMTYGELSNLIYKLTGGIDFSNRVYSDSKDEKAYYPKLVLSGKVVTDKLEDLFRLSNILVTETIFEDKKRIKELLLQTKSRMEMSINGRGDSYASRRLASYFLPVSKYIESIKGFEYYWFLSDLVNDFDKNSDEILIKLSELYKKVFNRNNLLISYTGDKKSFDVFKKYYEKAIDKTSKDKFVSNEYKFELSALNEGIMSSSNVQYVAKGFNFKHIGYKYSGAMQVLGTILNSEYLHDRVRAKGGAYGCGLSISDTGNCIVSSYRDPNLSETFKVYDEAYKYIESLGSGGEDLTRFIIGAISRVDGAMTARTKGVSSTANYITNTTQEDIQKERDEILNVTTKELNNFSVLIKEIMEKDYCCVFGNDVKIKSEEHLFDNLVSLNKIV